jgi:hypothetical protein
VTPTRECPELVSAAVGLAVRPGSAVTVIVKGTRRQPTIVLRHEIDLADAWVPESRHPYHQELGDRSRDAERARRRGCDVARKASRRSIRTFVKDMTAHGLQPCGAAIVTSSLVDPETIAGAHARAHAHEAKLYREAVEHALGSCGLNVVTFLDKRLRQQASGQLRSGSPPIDGTLKAFSHAVGTPWRAPEKQAALAAWCVLPR